MQSQLTPAEQLASADDWRPVFHLSPSAVLLRIGGSWSRLADSDVQLHDGWRFSDHVESEWYLRNVALLDPARRDPVTGGYLAIAATPAQKVLASQYRETIEGENYYRMRHVGSMELMVDAGSMQQPTLTDLHACVMPGDVLVRRVGSVAAAPVSSLHRRHPVDANIAVLRGLGARQAVWVAYCLNQLIYRSYFEQPSVIGGMVRVGLKQLARMPLAARPAEFDKLADQFWLHYESQVQADAQLQWLREEVAEWIADRFPDNRLASGPGGLIARFFEAGYISTVLNYSATEQNQFSRELMERFRCVPLEQVSELNPRGVANTDGVGRVVKIGDLSGQFDIETVTAAAANSRWRHHRHPLQSLTVLVSTFVQKPKVALFMDEQKTPTFASEQLAVVKFHRSPGAYALLLETDLVRQQIARLATGTVQRFVQPEQFRAIVLPEIDIATAQDWHQRLIDILRNKRAAWKELAELKKGMHLVYRQIHPAFTSDAQLELAVECKQ